MKTRFSSLLLIGLTSTGLLAQTTQNTLESPSAKEAKEAVLQLIDEDFVDVLGKAEFRLGTCVPAIKAEHKGQIACATAFVFPAGSSESQADFYKDSTGKWVARPSKSQDILPFPDPNLKLF